MRCLRVEHLSFVLPNVGSTPASIWPDTAEENQEELIRSREPRMRMPCTQNCQLLPQGEVFQNQVTKGDALRGSNPERSLSIRNMALF